MVEGPDRAPARAMLRAVGLTDDDFRRPLIGIANTWTETTPCNYHLRQLAQWVKEGVRAAGGTPLEFNTIVVSDGVSMGTEGMRASLASREVIADSIELVARGHMLDGLVALSGCDKTIPAAVMALAGLPRHSPVGPAAGLSAMLVICGIAVKLPGHAVTAAVAVGIALIGATIVFGWDGPFAGRIRIGAIIAALGAVVSQSLESGSAILVADYGTAARVGVPPSPPRSGPTFGPPLATYRQASHVA